MGRKYWKSLSEREHLQESVNYPLRLYTTKQMCHMLQISPFTFRERYIKSGKLVPLKADAKHHYYTLDDVKLALDIRFPGITEERKRACLAKFAKE